MNEILAWIREINKSRKRYGITFLDEGSGERPRVPVRPLMLSVRPPILPDIYHVVVGFNNDKVNIVNQLCDTRIKRLSVISIVGPGGLGKTTLASLVYNSNDIRRQFDFRIWVDVSQEYNLMDILRKIIGQVEPVHPIDMDDEEFLLKKLYKTLNGERYTVEDHLHPESHEPLSHEIDLMPLPKRYLLVLDDIWSSDLWTQIGSALPDAEIGSRVIITTRIQNIVNDAEPYKLQSLHEETSLDFLFRKALPNQDRSKGYPDDLYEVGKQIVKKCDGLPLSLEILGGLLSKRSANYAAWNKLLQTMNLQKSNEIISTSYNDLPYALKSCLMYFVVFPEDYKINAQRLF